MTRVSRGELPPSLFFLPSDSLARYSRFYPPYVMSARVTPSFTPVLLPSVLLLSGGGGGVGGRKVLPLLYSPLQPPPPPPATTTTCTTSASSWSSSIRNDEDSADLTKSFQELSRRLPVLVNSGHRLGSLDSLNRAGTPLPDYFRGSYFSFSFSCTFFFFFFLPLLKCEFFLFLFVRHFDLRKNALTRKYVHGGDTRRRHVFRDALVSLAPSIFRSCRKCSVSRRFIMTL